VGYVAGLVRRLLRRDGSRYQDNAVEFRSVKPLTVITLIGIVILFALLSLTIIVGTEADLERCRAHGGDHLGWLCYDKNGNVVDG
jgi:hypothetical protein